MRSRLPLPLAALATALVLPSDARAEPVLHEYVPRIAEAPTHVVGGGSEGENPSAIRLGNEAVAEPEVPPELRVLSADDRNGRNYVFEPDLDTRLDGPLRYQEEFTPSIVPFKRSKVLDVVRMPGYRLEVGDRGLRPLVVQGTGASTPDRDLFWVTLQLELGRRPVPIPSAAPDVRVLSYRTSTNVRLRFFRDGADNLYVRGPAGRRRRDPEFVRVTMLTDASAAYFGAELPGHVLLSALRAPTLPREAREAGLEVARQLDIRPSDTVREAVARLTAHFRSFEEADEAQTGHGDVYKDLALGRRGVCRHRSFAFMVTANALGLPTRYVENDAHAFVEVDLPDTGWMRIDLGGAAAAFHIEGAANRPRHEPRRPDDLPQPEAYRRSYSQLAAPSVEGAPRPVDRGLGPSVVPPGAPGAPEGPIDPTAIPERGGPAVPSAPTPRPGEAGAPSESPPAIPTRTVIDQAARRARRGTDIEVSGLVRTPGGPIPGMFVEVSLSKDGRSRFLLLGSTVTEEDGRFTGRFHLPPDLEPRTYHLLAGTPGDRFHASSQSAP